MYPGTKVNPTKLLKNMVRLEKAKDNRFQTKRDRTSQIEQIIKTPKRSRLVKRATAIADAAYLRVVEETLEQDPVELGYDFTHGRSSGSTKMLAG
jgi:hypothetical protein